MWLFCVLALLDSVCFDAFMYNTASIYQQKFNMGIQQTGLILSIPGSTVVVFAPFASTIFDRYGKRCFFLMLGFIFVLTSHLMFYAMPKCKPRDTCFESAGPMTLLSIGSAMIKLTLLTNLSLVSKPRYYGQAFGIYLSFANLGVIVGSLSIGYVVDLQISTARVGILHMLLTCFACVGLILSTYVCYNDEMTFGKLNAVLSQNEDS